MSILISWVNPWINIYGKNCCSAMLKISYIVFKIKFRIKVNVNAIKCMKYMQQAYHWGFQFWLWLTADRSYDTRMRGCNMYRLFVPCSPYLSHPLIRRHPFLQLTSLCCISNKMSRFKLDCNNVILVNWRGNMQTDQKCFTCRLSLL